MECFSFTLRQRNLSTPQSTVHFVFAFVFEESSVGEITWFSWRHRVQKSSTQWCKGPQNETRSRRKFQKSSGWKSVRWRKAPFSWRITVDVRPTVEIKLRFQISRSEKCERGLGCTDDASSNSLSCSLHVELRKPSSQRENFRDVTFRKLNRCCEWWNAPCHAFLNLLF